MAASKIVLFACVVFGTSYSHSAFSQSTMPRSDFDDLNSEVSFLEENPYVKLYQKRLEVAQLQVKSQVTVTENERIKWVRMQGLVSRGAVPLNDAEEQEKRWKMAAKRVEILKSRTVEAQALLEIAKQRTDAGIDMPVCSLRR